ncbi:MULTISPECIES: hypothetical protein [unclassified Salinibacterium]|uniref:DUF7144 family membrane protein n=1 Tax=unclassified Salinibacterium TaxID=2632331 RepID=UPI001AB03FB4|nr:MULTISPECIES: hypothetical protein [unclassified Salinibacterium]
MTSTTGRTTDSGRSADRDYSVVAAGSILFAGVIMIMVGAFHILQALVALFNDEFYVAGPEYVYQFDLTSWGWIHLLGGVVLVFGGVALFRGAMWARILAVVLASLSALVNFMWLPYYPLWGTILIALDVFIIWAVLAHSRDLIRSGK